MVLAAYLPLKQLTPQLRGIATRVPINQRGVEYKEFPAEFILIGHQDVELVSKMHESYVPAFDAAIKELGSRLGGAC